MNTTLSHINQEIEKFQDSLSNHNLYEPVKYILSLDGKRIRPALLLDTVKTFNGNEQEAMPLAIAVEVFHNFTLLHDDIMDQSDLRRGQPTVHVKWDESAAILSGDVMLILAYQLIEQLPEKHQPKILKAFNKMAVWLCEGQQDDMDFEKEEDVAIEPYIGMIKNKTSVLLAFCLEAGAILADVEESIQKSIYNFGINLGIAFQLQDDFMDLYPKSALMGKKIGGDLLNKKKALPLLLALKHDDKKALILQELNQPDEARINRLLAIFETLNVKESCEALIAQYYQKAHQNLSEITNFDTQLFVSFAESLKKRQK